MPHAYVMTVNTAKYKYVLMGASLNTLVNQICWHVLNLFTFVKWRNSYMNNLVPSADTTIAISHKDF